MDVAPAPFIGAPTPAPADLAALVLARCGPRVQTLAMAGSGHVCFALGTNHISSEACTRAAELVKLVKPDCLFLELCNKRQVMLLPVKEMPAGAERPTFQGALRAMREGADAFSAIYPVVASSVADDIGSSFGREFYAAASAAEDVSAAESRPAADIVLGDRDVGVTISRMWRGLSPWSKLRLVANLIWMAFADVEEELAKMKKMEEDPTCDVLSEAISELAEDFPSFKVVLIDERDLFMQYMLRRCVRRYPRTVAIVGAGHIQGLKRRWERIEAGEEDEVSEAQALALLEVPPPPSGADRVMTGILFVGAPVAVVAVAGAGLYVAVRLAAKGLEKLRQQ